MVFLTALAVGLVVNLVAYALLGTWGSPLGTVVVSVLVAAGVWLGQRMRRARE